MHLTKEGNNHIVLMTNNAYGSNLNLHISNIEKLHASLQIDAMDGISFEKNHHNYIQILEAPSDINKDDDDVYSYIS